MSARRFLTWKVFISIVMFKYIQNFMKIGPFYFTFSSAQHYFLQSQKLDFSISAPNQTKFNLAKSNWRTWQFTHQFCFLIQLKLAKCSHSNCVLSVVSFNQILRNYKPNHTNGKVPAKILINKVYYVLLADEIRAADGSFVLLPIFQLC